jgi:hypothetical protein
MTKRIARYLAVIAITVAAVSTSAFAQDETKAASVAGTWTMTVMSHQVGLVLAQDGKKVTGTFMLMGKDVPMEGEFVDGTLTLTSNARIMTPPAAGAAAVHGGAATPGAPLAITAKLQDDGTLAGEMPNGSGQPLTWIAERLRERKVRPSAAAVAGGSGLTGAWKAVVIAPQGKMEFDLAIRQDGEKVSGTFTSEHSGEVPFEGTFAHGALKLTSSTDGGGTDPHAMHLDYTATLKADGTLAGELTGPQANMKWTAERVKK